MNFLVSFFTFFSRYTKRIGLCGNVGLIAGSLAGLILFLLYLMHGNLVLSQTRALQLSLLLTGFTWIVNLFVLCVLARLTFRSVALPSLLNGLLTCLATVFLTRYLNAYSLAWLIGLVVGIAIGMLLCRINAIFYKLTH